MLKKLLLVFLMLGVLVSSSIAVCAKENMIAKEDSKTISEEVREKLNVKASDVVLKLYNVAIISAFAKYQDIDSILKRDNIRQEFYAVKTSHGTYTYLEEVEGKALSTHFIYRNDKAVKMCETGEVTEYIASDVVVYNTYCLYGASDGTAIYYETNKGDYVYYSHYAVGERLFPVAAFCAYAKAVQEEAVKYGDYDGGTNQYDVWDLSPYDFKADTFNLNAKIPEQNSANSGNAKTTGWVIAAVGSCLLIAAIAGGFVYRRKRSSVLE